MKNYLINYLKYYAVKNHILVLLAMLFAYGCTSKGSALEANESEYFLPERPNILWLVTEDMGAYIPAFGDSSAITPNLNRLAREGVIYTNLYSTSGVCAPSRAAIATGMYPSSIGANHMRTDSYTEVTGLPKYEAVPGPEVKMVSELLREKGYYTSNNYKEDYQFKAPVTAWDENGPYAHWRNRAEDQPFYSIFNFTTTHESGLFEPYGFRNIEMRHYHSGDTTYKWEPGNMTETETPVHVSKDQEFAVPPYLPNTPIVQRDMWKLYNNISEMDRQLGAILAQLEEDGLLENTIIVFYGDHGGPLPREKRLIYDSGLNTPMIIRYPNSWRAGSKDDQLISFVDFAPTLLSLIGEKPLDYMQGQAFLGDFQAQEKREYIHGAADRFDEVTDAIRAVRDKQFKYIRNYRPNQGYYLPLTYREQIPTMQELLRMNESGELNASQAQWFRKSKLKEELYDCEADPYELNNLAEDPNYQEKLKELSNELDRWLTDIDDRPNLPEQELIKRLWSGAGSKPTTADPKIKITNGKIEIQSATEGASIGYKLINSDGKQSPTWSIYQEPIDVEEVESIWVKAHRIGYNPSQVIKQNLN
ncbi:sulfatase-like hydrolase/transferase [Algoriphagus winogradskyi]|uniref:Arylsulfatase A n=1 Tax=Algoriphagus winogradskyi TaxID=237017 RepID=A0ABY1NXQ6_9BACT|nr:sulfatase-like hydrolase/transferase [Algoriphagus winogradskyi]SMP21120.1 Arylsulfatase A [Algoriphagus winogradskyi]